MSRRPAFGLGSSSTPPLPRRPPERRALRAPCHTRQSGPGGHPGHHAAHHQRSRRGLALGAAHLGGPCRDHLVDRRCQAAPVRGPPPQPDRAGAGPPAGGGAGRRSARCFDRGGHRGPASTPLAGRGGAARAPGGLDPPQPPGPRTGPRGCDGSTGPGDGRRGALRLPDQGPEARRPDLPGALRGPGSLWRSILGSRGPAGRRRSPPSVRWRGSLGAPGDHLDAIPGR